MKSPLQASVDLAGAIADLPDPDQRLDAFQQITDAAWKLKGDSQVAALHLNAEVTTLLRERRVAPFSSDTCGW